ncbi:hypothetical protein AT6N2_C2227 [Agrobacterium tumefaciens]|nr:hypothetical protein AT6N2_C2227 [Agrobacterium tumefaciens]
MQDAAGGCALDLWLGSLQSFGSDSEITGSDCFLDLANEAANARTASLVDCGTASDLAGRLFRRSCIGHVCLSSNSNQIPQP